MCFLVLPQPNMYYIYYFFVLVFSWMLFTWVRFLKLQVTLTHCQMSWLHLQGSLKQTTNNESYVFSFCMFVGWAPSLIVDRAPILNVCCPCFTIALVVSLLPLFHYCLCSSCFIWDFEFGPICHLTRRCLGIGWTTMWRCTLLLW